MRAFKSPARWLAGIDSDAAAGLIAAAADLAVVIDREGIVRDYAFQTDALQQDFGAPHTWLGQRWRDHVTAESRPKIDDILRALRQTPQTRQSRQVNYNASPSEIPVLLTVLSVGPGGNVIAMGRDLRAFSALQQRVVEAQQSFERDFARMRQIETRYRILMQMTPQPVLVVELPSLKITEANPAAREVFLNEPKLLGAAFAELVAPGSTAALETLLADARATGRADDILIRLAGYDADVSAAAFLFRQGAAQLLLLRLAAVGGQALTPLASAPPPPLLRLVENVPDGFVVTNSAGRVIAANDAFLEMAQLRNEAQAQGESLDRWLGRAGVDLAVLLTNLRQHGTVRMFASAIRDEFGAETDVEISAGAVKNGGTPSYGFAIRPVSRRVEGTATAAAAPRQFPKSLEQIVELIGRVSLKDLVREATDVIERLSIEAALTITGNNRASAAEVLGVSRQSLYVKMRRHGLIDAEPVALE
jgi:transcriptional regulator PpsR